MDLMGLKIVREGGVCDCAPELGSLYTVILRDGRKYEKAHIQGSGGTLKNGQIPTYSRGESMTLFLANRASHYFTIPIDSALIESITAEPSCRSPE